MSLDSAKTKVEMSSDTGVQWNLCVCVPESVYIICLSYKYWDQSSWKRSVSIKFYAELLGCSAGGSYHTSLYSMCVSVILINWNYNMLLYRLFEPLHICNMHQHTFTPDYMHVDLFTRLVSKPLAYYMLMCWIRLQIASYTQEHTHTHAPSNRNLSILGLAKNLRCEKFAISFNQL